MRKVLSPFSRMRWTPSTSETSIERMPAYDATVSVESPSVSVTSTS
ncbi:Uncharacterised protein [Mycobacteroides abscessus]|nr:Uncharacterised protein [Mycobacteroides abscessus]